jgi:hypothetical protein
LERDTVRDAANGCRTLLDGFLVSLDVEIRGAGKLNVALHEEGLRNRAVETTGVGGGT